MSITINSTFKNGETRSFVYESGETLADAIDLFGETAVFNIFRQKLIIQLNGKIKATVESLTNPKNPDVVALDFDEAYAKAVEQAKAWKPGQFSPKKSKIEKSLGGIVDLTDDEIAQVEVQKDMASGELLTIRDQLREAMNWTGGDALEG